MSIAMLTATRKHAMILGFVAGIASLVIAGVFSSAGISSFTNSNAPPQTLKVAVLTDALFDDGGWGSASSRAADMIRGKYDFEVATQDNVSIADIETTLQRYAEARYDLIIAHGVQWGDPAVRVGQQFRDVKIVVFTGLVESQNVASVFPMQQEGSFLIVKIFCSWKQELNVRYGFVFSSEPNRSMLHQIPVVCAFKTVRNHALEAPF